MEAKERANDNIFKLERVRESLENELKMILTLPERNPNGFANANRVKCIQRVKRKLKYNQNAIEYHQEILASLTN